MDNTCQPYEQQEQLFLGHQPDGSYVLQCRWCRKVTAMSPEEVQWYRERSYEMPTRCLPCRRKRRGIAKHYASLTA